MAARTLWRVSLAPGRQSARSRRQTGMRLPGRSGRRSVYGLEHRQQRQLHLKYIGVVSGADYALQSLETSFHQDLNGDGLIGLPTTVIEANGSTSLTEVGKSLFPLRQRRVGPLAEICRCGLSWRVSLAPGRQSARSRRQTGMRLPGRSRAPISTRFGTPTAAATTSQIHRRCVGG